MSWLCKKFMFKSFVQMVLIGLLLLVGSSCLVSYRVQSKYSDLTSFEIGDVPNAEAAIVLGARVYGDERLSDVYRDRVQTALELYLSGKVRKILVSGDHGRKDYDEVNAAKSYLLEQGVPGEDIFLDHAGFDTYDSMYRARDVFLADELIVVTQSFHLPRAVYVARELGLEAHGVSADRHEYLNAGRNEAREALARIKAWLDVAFKSKPKFLGESVPISGDGRLSWD